MKCDRHCCRGAWHMPERSDNSKYKSRGFETLRDLTIRHLIGYWNKVRMSSSMHGLGYEINPIFVSISYALFFVYNEGIYVIIYLTWMFTLVHVFVSWSIGFVWWFVKLYIIRHRLAGHCPWVHKDYGTRGPGIVQMKTLKCLLVFICELFLGAFGIIIQHCLNMSSLVSMMACRLFSSEPLSKQVASQFLLFIHTSARPNATRHTSGFPLSISQSYTAPVSDYQLWQCVGNTS